MKHIFLAMLLMTAIDGGTGGGDALPPGPVEGTPSAEAVEAVAEASAETEATAEAEEA